MKRGVFVNVLELFGVVARTVFDHPSPTYGEEVVTEHVEHAHLREGHGEEVGTLRHAGAHKESAVGAARYGEFPAGGIFVPDEILARRDEVIEDVLLVGKHARLVPLLAVLVAAAQIDRGIDGTLLHHGNVRGAESGRQRGVETAVTVEVHGILAVLLQPLVIGEEHGHLCAVLAGEEDLFGHEVVRIELHFRPGEERGLSGSQVVAVHGGRRGEGGEGIERLGRIVLPVETGYGTDTGEGDLTHQVAVECILVNAAGGILHVDGEDVVTHEMHRLQQHVRVLGQYLLGRRRHKADIQPEQMVVGRPFVGVEVEHVVPDLGHGIFVVEPFEDDTERLAHTCALVHQLRTGRSFRNAYEEVFARIAVIETVVIAERVKRVGIDDFVFGLRRTQPVVVNLLELVLARKLGTFRRLLVTAVIEPLGIGRPVRTGELHPADDIVEHPARGDLLDEYLHPVGTRPGDTVGHIFPVFRKSNAVEGGGPVGRQGIGVEKDLGLRVIEAVKHVEDALVLQSVVAEIEIAVAHLGRRSYLLVVPQLREAFVYGRTVGYLRKVIERHLVLSSNPCRRFGGIVVLQPPVGVGHHRAVVVIRDIDLRRLRIGFHLNLHLFLRGTVCHCEAQHRQRDIKRDSLHRLSF